MINAAIGECAAGATTDATQLKSSNSLQRPTRLCMDRGELGRRVTKLSDLFREFRHGAKPIRPGMDARM